MGYVLYGSQTSPFVRRIKILLDGIPYEYKEVNVFEAQDAVTLNKINPINRIPVLVDGDVTIWDSRIIFGYLNSIHRFQNMDWNDENLLTAIDEVTGSAVALLQLKRSGINTEEPYMFVNRQKDRIESILDYLRPYIQKDAMEEWNFLTISLYCLLDWGTFRGLFSLEYRPECKALLEKYKSKEIVQSTALPKV